MAGRVEDAVVIGASRLCLSGALDWMSAAASIHDNRFKPLPALNFLTGFRTRIKIARLMETQPPQFIEPLRLARQEAAISGRLPIRDMKRLSEAITSHGGDIEFSLKFGRDSGGIHCIIGHLKTTVEMQCQRCMQTLSLNLRGDIQLGIVQGEEEARRLPSAYEPLLVEQASLRLAELIEDEALLLLPLVPMHEDVGCADDVPIVAEDEVPAEPDTAETHRPFADQLGKLRQRDK